MQHGVFKTDVEFRKLQETQQWARLCYVQNITSPRTMWTVRLQRKPSINAHTHTHISTRRAALDSFNSCRLRKVILVSLHSHGNGH